VLLLLLLADAGQCRNTVDLFLHQNMRLETRLGGLAVTRGGTVVSAPSTHPSGENTRLTMCSGG